MILVLFAIPALSAAFTLNGVPHINNFDTILSSTRLNTAHSDPEFYRRNKILRTIIDDQPESSEDFSPLGSFDIDGQGAVGFKFVLDNEAEEVRFRFDPAGCDTDSAHPILHTISNVNGWTVTDLVTNEVLATATDDRGFPLLNQGRNETFWMSFDKENLVLRGGTGYMITALQLFEKRFEEPTKNPGPVTKASYLTKYGKLSSYSMYKPQSVVKDGKTVELITSKYPIYKDLPPIVKDHQDMTLEDLGTGRAVSIKELSPECQRLHENMAGANIKMNTPDFPDFAQAIDYSINHGFCKYRLQEKAKDEFVGSDDGEYDANGTYLRITLGSNLGDSPGIPYVMEIWPPGCYSPIHDHSQANAIIKVLHGSLTTRWFESLDRAQQQQEQNGVNAVPYDQAVLSEGDVTWLDERQFQTHQLFNHNIDGTACVTIQCYVYNNRDNSHYENFDYIGGDEDLHPFVPNSDWDYSVFMEKVKAEFSKYKKKAAPQADMKKR